jgi:methylenetetrahydrofolate dehydrogenase (NADP+)/methenyltetrahydrofolate cyclohydrolase
MILDGKACSKRRLEILREEIDESGLHPHLATVIAGTDPASQIYVRMKHRACDQVHIGSVGIELPGDATTDQVTGAIRRLNDDPEIDGILVQLPLPAQVNTESVIRAVSTGKDVDGFHPCNLGLLLSGKPVFVPCTPKGIMTLLSEHRIGVAGQHAVVVGRSIEVGRPMAALLTGADATVTLCHSRTQNLAAETSRAGILVCAVGKAHFIRAEMVKPGAVVIDAGTNRIDGKLVGDVDFEAVKEIAGAITPVPGGVGPMTVATLMENTFQAARLRACGTVW